MATGPWRRAADKRSEVSKRIAEAFENGSTELDLSHLELKKLPDSVRRLEHLTTLSLFNNQIERLPDWIGSLSGLAKIDLRLNRIEQLPRSMAGLGRLTVLEMHSNKLAALPDWLPRLTALATLSVGYNAVSAVPDWLGRMVSLEVLELAHNPEISLLPAGMGDLVELVSLDISGCQRLKAIPDSLGRLRNLTSLRVDYLGLGSVPKWMAGLTRLTELSLIINDLTDLPEWMAGLDRLVRLRLSYNRLTELPVWLGGLADLRELEVKGNPLREADATPAASGSAVLLRTLRSRYAESMPRRAPAAPITGARAADAVWVVEQAEVLAAGAGAGTGSGFDPILTKAEVRSLWPHLEPGQVDSLMAALEELGVLYRIDGLGDPDAVALVCDRLPADGLGTPDARDGRQVRRRYLPGYALPGRALPGRALPGIIAELAARQHRYTVGLTGADGVAFAESRYGDTAVLRAGDDGGLTLDVWSRLDPARFLGVLDESLRRIFEQRQAEVVSQVPCRCQGFGAQPCPHVFEEPFLCELAERGAEVVRCPVHGVDVEVAALFEG